MQEECGWQGPNAQAWASISRHCSLRQVPKHSFGLSWGEFFQIKMAWLAASDSGRFTAPNLFYLPCLSLIISCQETDNRSKEAFWLSQVLGSPKGFRGLQRTRLRQSDGVPLGSPVRSPLVLKQHGFSGVPWQYSISSQPMMAEMELPVY